ncbi:MAG: Gx transporter family protein [Treponema sp.]|nr:Gx transporter family protein [Treponema sp.]
MLTLSSGEKTLEARNLDASSLALLGAFCLFLSAVEYMIPKPLPFMRIGLANLPIMLGLCIFPLRSFVILICIKVFGQALITGTLFSYIFLFSFTGTFLSALFMFFLQKIAKDNITFIGIGAAGAVISNISQLALAYMFIFKESVRYITPPFLAAGLVTGIVLGVFCEMFVRRSRWIKTIIFSHGGTEARSCCSNLSFIEHKIKNRLLFYNNIFSAEMLFLAGLLIIPAVLFNPSTEYRVYQFLFFCFLVLLSGKKTDFLFTVFVTFIVIAFNLIIPYGRVLFSIGVFKITSGALEAGIHRAVTLQALVMLSKITIRKDLILPGAFGQLLGESMCIFSEIMSRKFKIKGKNIFDKNIFYKIDNLMMELSDIKFTQQPIQKIHTKPAGYVILIAVIIISWLPWFILF